MSLHEDIDQLNREGYERLSQKLITARIEMIDFIHRGLKRALTDDLETLQTGATEGGFFVTIDPGLAADLDDPEQRVLCITLMDTPVASKLGQHIIRLGLPYPNELDVHDVNFDVATLQRPDQALIQEVKDETSNRFWVTSLGTLPFVASEDGVEADIAQEGDIQTLGLDLQTTERAKSMAKEISFLDYIYACLVDMKLYRTRLDPELDLDI